MGDRHVMNDPVPVDRLCACGCGRTCPAAPAGGGRAPRYASRGCQQRAYRVRQAARTAPPADPASAADLLDAVRALAGVLDAGGRPDHELLVAVRDGTATLLARATPTAPDVDPGASLPPMVSASDTAIGHRSSRDDRVQQSCENSTGTPLTPLDDRHVTINPGPPAPDLEVAGPRPPGSRRRKARPVVVRSNAGDVALSAELSAAVRAVAHAADGDVPTLHRLESSDPGGAQVVSLGGVRLGVVRPAYGPQHGKAWEARDVMGTVARTWKGGRLNMTHPRRGTAVDALIFHLRSLASRADRASLRSRSSRPAGTTPPIVT
ncbi:MULTISPECIES: hypothetical protein [Parafrankia]|nr:MULTISPECIES: hypothetical protein [Parafrankia]MBE3206425.1 hypothetical protein [Parafrankia sp. CH37]